MLSCLSSCAPVAVSSGTAPAAYDVYPNGSETEIRIGDPDRTSSGRHRCRVQYPAADVASGHLSPHEGVTLYGTAGRPLDGAPRLPVPASNLPAGGGGRLLAPGLLAVAAALIGPALAVPAIRRAGRERVVAGAVAAGWADPGRRSGRVALGGLVATLVGFAMSPATTASAQPDPNLTVETVALFDANALETPENIAIDNHNNKYISLALTGEIRKIAPDGSQSTVANLPLGAPPLTVCGPFFAGLTGITLDQHDNLYANLASCDPDSRGCGRSRATGSRNASRRSQWRRCPTRSCIMPATCTPPTRRWALSGGCPTRAGRRRSGRAARNSRRWAAGCRDFPVPPPRRPSLMRVSLEVPGFLQP